MMPNVNGLHANSYYSNCNKPKNPINNAHILKLNGCSNKPTYGDNSVGHPHNFHSLARELYNLAHPATEPLDSNCPPLALKGSWLKKFFVNLMWYTDIAGIEFQHSEKQKIPENTGLTRHPLSYSDEQCRIPSKPHSRKKKPSIESPGKQNPAESVPPADPQSGNAITNNAFFLPGTEATPLKNNERQIVHDTESGYYVIATEQDKKDLITSLQRHLVANGPVNEDEGADIEFSLRTIAADSAVLLIPLYATENSFSDRNGPAKEKIKKTADTEAKDIYAKNICNEKGEVQGQIIVLSKTFSQELLQELHLDTASSPLSETKQQSKKRDPAAHLLMFGLNLPHGKMLESVIKQDYAHNSVNAGNDKSTTSASLITSQINQTSPGEKPEALNGIIPVKSRAIFYIENPHTGIRKEVLLVLNPSNEGMTNGTPVILLPTEKDNEFVTQTSDAENSEQTAKKIIFNDSNNTWNYADDASKELNVNVIEGHSQINFYGDYYQIKTDKKGGYLIAFEKQSGVKEYLPVYRNPLSGTWQSKIHNGHFAYSDKDEKIIDKLAVDIVSEFNYVKSQDDITTWYGVKEIYETHKKGDPEKYVWGKYIEMNGKVVPVRNILQEGFKAQYEVYDSKNPDQKGYSIEWNGTQWVLEGSTSVYVSPEFEDQITTDMLEKNIDTSTLSAPDSMGLRTNTDGKQYVKVKDGYLRIEKKQKELFVTKPDGTIISLETEKGKLHSRHNNDEVQNITKDGNNRPPRSVNLNTCPTGDEQIKQYDKLSETNTIVTVKHRADVRSHVAENSLSAFRLAYQQCRPAIETDVLTTADDELVIFHDMFIGKMMEPDYDPDKDLGPNKELEKCTLAYLKTKNLLDPNRRPTQDKILTVKELIQDYREQKAQSLLYLEVKAPKAILRVAKIISDEALKDPSLLKRLVVKFNMAEFPTYKDWVDGLRKVGANTKVMANPVMNPNASSRLNLQRYELENPKGLNLPDNASRAVYSWSKVPGDIVPNVEVVIKNSDDFKNKILKKSPQGDYYAPTSLDISNTIPGSAAYMAAIVKQNKKALGTYIPVPDRPMWRKDHISGKTVPLWHNKNKRIDITKAYYTNRSVCCYSLTDIQHSSESADIRMNIAWNLDIGANVITTDDTYSTELYADKQRKLNKLLVPYISYPPGEMRSVLSWDLGYAIGPSLAGYNMKALGGNEYSSWGDNNAFMTIHTKILMPGYLNVMCLPTPCQTIINY
ncbi:hypothetical protein J2X14_001805 [Pantoea alhagi]|uniref:glycerophosphodiester phosphodiesterase family protein n=1 Tax=Mixta sp. BE291 TaxID=3158787 RepID=UPI00286319AC|nr:hypothetical protein [Pantoea alhagi]